MSNDDLEFIEIVSALGQAKLQKAVVELTKDRKFDEARLTLLVIQDLEKVYKIVEKAKNVE